MCPVCEGWLYGLQGGTVEPSLAGPSVTLSTRLHLAAPGHGTNHSFSGPAFQHFDSVDGGPRLCWTSGLRISSSPYSAAGIVLASIAVLI